MKMKKMLTSMLVLSMTASALYPAQSSFAATAASNNIVLSTSKVALTVGKSKQISANQAVTWKISNKKIVQAKKITAKKLKITAKKPGSCTILAQKGKKKARVSIRVTTPKKVDAIATPLVAAVPVNTVQTAAPNPLTTMTPTPVATTTVSQSPAATFTAQATQTPIATTTATTQATQSPTVTSNVTTTPFATVDANTGATTTPDSGMQTPEPTICVSTSPAVTSSPGITETATPVPTETPVVTETPAIPVSEVEMTVREIKDNRATLSFTNHSDLYAFYVYNFTLEKKVDGEWKKMPTLPNYPTEIPDLETTLEPGRTKVYEVNVDLDAYGIPLQAGIYRLVEPVRLYDPNSNDDGKIITCYGEFTILLEDGVLSNFGFTRSHSYLPSYDLDSKIIYTREQFDSLTDAHGNSDRMPKEVTEFADSIDFSKSALAIQIITCRSGSTQLELHSATVQNNAYPFVKFDYELHTPAGEVTCDMISYILYAEVPLTYILK